jgi:hypothetical protein
MTYLPPQPSNENRAAEVAAADDEDRPGVAQPDVAAQMMKPTPATAHQQPARCRFIILVTARAARRLTAADPIEIDDRGNHLHQRARWCGES